MLTAFALAAAVQAQLTLGDARRSLVGQWQGKLEYRDYRADRWFGLPVTVDVRDGGDGVTLIRVADFDDGPATGTVRITTASMMTPDGAGESSVSFRKGQQPELTTSRLRLASGTAPNRWVIVSELEGRDNDRPARIRETTTRAGDAIVTMKEVDYSDDQSEDWLVRNRTTLTRLAPTSR